MTTSARPSPVVGLKPVAPEQSTQIHYPESDGEPMGETGFHVRQIITIAVILRDLFRDRTDVYVGANMFLYYRQGDPSGVVSPDVFAVFNTTSEERRTWKLWEEHGRVPAIVFEITSDETQDKDRFFKRALYEELGVQEYFLFDPLGQYLKPALQGYRLAEGRYVALEPITLSQNLIGLESQTLKTLLRAEENGLGFYHLETGERLLPPHEAYSQLRLETQSRQAAEIQAEVEAQARRAAEIQAKTEAKARQAAEAEVARLQAELKQLKGE